MSRVWFEIAHVTVMLQGFCERLHETRRFVSSLVLQSGGNGEPERVSEMQTRPTQSLLALGSITISMYSRIAPQELETISLYCQFAIGERKFPREVVC